MKATEAPAWNRRAETDAELDGLGKILIVLSCHCLLGTSSALLLGFGLAGFNEDLRKRELEESNAQSLFDDTPAQVQPTGYNQGYQQQGAVDWLP
jgi:hypothetical protein